MLQKEWSRVLPLLAYKDLEWPERKWLPRNWPECVPNSDARGEVALLAILVDFEGTPNIYICGERYEVDFGTLI